MKKNKRAEQWQANQDKAEKMCDKFYNVLEYLDCFDKYPVIVLKVLMARLNQEEKKDLCESMELEIGCRIMHFDSLAQEMKFEAFEQELKDNPYQLKLIA